MKAGFFEEPFIATILREILKGLEYLHSERKLHRDVKGIKCAACLFAQDGLIISLNVASNRFAASLLSGYWFLWCATMRTLKCAQFAEWLFVAAVYCYASCCSLYASHYCLLNMHRGGLSSKQAVHYKWLKGKLDRNGRFFIFARFLDF